MRIGYIYYYDETLEKGVICYGHVTSGFGSDDVDVFSKSCCKDSIKSGDLVYFELENGKICGIVKATLCNFERDTIYTLTQGFDDSCDEYTFLHNNSKISYIYDETAEEILCGEDDEDRLNKMTIDYELKLFESTDVVEHTKKALSGQFSYFESGTCYIDILDISNWAVKDSVSRGDYYGSSFQEVLDLLEIFEIKKRAAAKRRFKPSTTEESHYQAYKEARISNSWSFLFQRLNDTELLYILENNPYTQPCMPKDFCLRNIDRLISDYDFVDDDICFAFYDYKISQCNSIHEYSNIKYILDKAKNYEGSDAPSHDDYCHIMTLEKAHINNLIIKLEERLETVVLPLLCETIRVMQQSNQTDCFSIKNLINNKEEAVKIGDFIEYISCIKDSQEYISSYSMLFFAEKYQNLNDGNKSALNPLFCESIEIAFSRVDFAFDYRESAITCLFSILRDSMPEGKYSHLLQEVVPLILPDR